METPNDLADRYVAVWNEPNDDVRRKYLTDLWTVDTVHLVQPSEEMSATATRLGMVATLEVIGHAAMETRVAKAYEEFVGSGTYLFRRHGNAARVRNVVKLSWAMVATATDEVAAIGTDILTLAADGRIHLDYQFIEA